MLGIPTAIHVFLVWLPTLGSIVLSFTRWNGIGGLSAIEPIGLKNYTDIFSIYPPFWPSLYHNVLWLAVLGLVATPFGILLAVLLDREMRGTRIYQSAFFLPVVLSLAIIGFITTLIFAPEQGLVNNLLGTTKQGNLINWLGDPNINLWAVLLFASWRHAGYIMILYLAGLKSVDPIAARGSGDRRRQSAPGVLPGRLSGHAADQYRRPGRHHHRGAARVRPGVRDQQGPQRTRVDLGPGHQQHHRRGEPDRLRLGAAR